MVFFIVIIGYSRYIEKQFLKTLIDWSERIEIEKITLTLIDANPIYQRYDFIQEGLLIQDRLHKDVKYYKTMIMSRF